MLGPVLDCGSIDGKPLRLVPIREEHLPAYVRWLNDPEVTRYLSMVFGMSEADERRWYERALEDARGVYWAIELDGVHIGGAGLEALDWRARTGVTGTFIGEKEYWRRGVASAVMARRRDYAFRQLNLVALFTEIYLPNEGSLRAALKTGYREYGRRPYARFLDGEYVTAWLGVVSRPECEPPPPAPLAERG